MTKKKAHPKLPKNFGITREYAKAKPMNAIILLIGRRLIAAVEKEMRAINSEIQKDYD